MFVNFTISETTEKKRQTNFDYFLFDDDWEVKQGLWVFQIIEDDKILFEKSFAIELYYKGEAYTFIFSVQQVSKKDILYNLSSPPAGGDRGL